jgi:hypothetical protein
MQLICCWGNSYNCILLSPRNSGWATDPARDSTTSRSAARQLQLSCAARDQPWRQRMTLMEFTTSATLCASRATVSTSSRCRPVLREPRLHIGGDHFVSRGVRRLWKDCAAREGGGDNVSAQKRIQALRCDGGEKQIIFSGTHGYLRSTQHNVGFAIIRNESKAFQVRLLGGKFGRIPSTGERT